MRRGPPRECRIARVLENWKGWEQPMVYSSDCQHASSGCGPGTMSAISGSVPADSCRSDCFARRVSMRRASLSRRRSARSRSRCRLAAVILLCPAMDTVSFCATRRIRTLAPFRTSVESHVQSRARLVRAYTPAYDRRRVAQRHAGTSTARRPSAG